MQTIIFGIYLDEKQPQVNLFSYKKLAECYTFYIEYFEDEGKIKFSHYKEDGKTCVVENNNFKKSLMKILRTICVFAQTLTVFFFNWKI